MVGLATGCQFAADGQNVQGVRYFQSGRYQDAMQQFQRVLATNPANSDAYYNMASTYHTMGYQQQDASMVQQAEALYNQCLDLSPDHPDCHRGLAVLLVQTEREDSAFKLLKNWAMRSPHVADARVELARLYDEFDQPETAQLHLQQALQIDQTNSRAWAALANLREEAGDYSQALANYQRSYQLNTLQPQIGQRIALLNRRLATTSGFGSTGAGTRMVTPGVTPRY